MHGSGRRADQHRRRRGAYRRRALDISLVQPAQCRFECSGIDNIRAKYHRRHDCFIKLEKESDGQR